MATVASIDPVPIGFQVTLSCSASGITPLTYNWTRQDNPSDVLSTDQVYTFTISDSSGYGSYVCGVSNSLGSDTDNVTVIQASEFYVYCIIMFYIIEIVCTIKTLRSLSYCPNNFRYIGSVNLYHSVVLYSRDDSQWWAWSQPKIIFRNYSRLLDSIVQA